jgi:hypothetical protein
MFGVPINGLADALCDDQSVVKNASIPKFTLSKKLNSVNCNLFCESAVAGIIQVRNEDMEMNLADGLG